MLTTIDETYRRLKAEERELEGRLATLRVQLSTLEMVGAKPEPETNGHQPPVRPAYAREAQGMGSGRAPNGELVKRILELLKADGPLTNGQIRAKLTASGYKWALTLMHVSKTLTKLHQAKKVKIDGPINNRTYRVP